MAGKKNIKKSLALAAAHGDAAKVAELLAKGASPNSDDGGKVGYGHRTALGAASKLLSGECAKLLLDAGADPELCMNATEAPPVAIAALGSVAVLRLLLAAGASPNAKNEHGDSALALAANFGQIETLRLLLDSGALLDERNEDGRTAAMLAAGENEAGTLLALIEAGADVGAKCGQGKTAMDYAKGNGDEHAGGGPECVALLEAFELASVVKKTDAGNSGPRL